MAMIQQDPAAIQGGVMEASDKVIAIINNLEIVKGQVVGLVQDLSCLDSGNITFLELKLTADSCAGQISQAVSTALSLQGKHMDLASCFTGPSPRTTQRTRTIILDIQHEIGALNMLTSSLKQSLDRLKELSEPLHASNRAARRKIRTNVEIGLRCLAGAAILAIGIATSPIVGGMAIGALAAVLTPAAPKVIDTAKGMALPRIDWEAVLCHIDASRETVANIQTTEQGLKDHVSETLTFLDEYEEMKRELQMLKARMGYSTI